MDTSSETVLITAPQEEISTDRLFATLSASGKNYDLEKIRRAFDYASELHAGQYRHSGEPYVSHPLAVAEIVASLGLDTDSICAAFLHDVVEDCGEKTSVDSIREQFGDEVAMLVDGLTKIESVHIEDKEEAQMESVRKMLLAMSKDIRVIFIKLCDRLHNMRTLSAMPENKRRVKALETMNVYAPIAHRLGMQRVKQELENLALSYLDPIGYAEVTENIERKYGQNRDFLENVREEISARLSEEHIRFTIEGRVKTVYSIYNKMFNQNKTFDQIYDFYALRVIVDTVADCYYVLGRIHGMYKSIPNRIKDYISTPKPNMYKSLHTTVIGHDGVPFEVQVRTWEMHHVAEYGVAAHWKYKSGVQEKDKKELDENLSWISKLIDTEQTAIDPDEFMRALKIDLFHDETFIFTPKGEVKSMPLGSTVIDFAYAIHTDVGNRMTGAKINGVISPIDAIPQNGDIVEILTSSSSRGPSRDWLNVVKTSEARSKIRNWFKKEKRAENIVVGKAEISREMTRIARQLTDEQRAEIVASVAKRVGMADTDDLFNAIGYGGITMARLSVKLKDEYDRFVKRMEVREIPATADDVHTQELHRTHTGGILIEGEAGCSVKFAKCCSPLPGDEVIGFVTKGFGVSIHKKDCPNVLKNLDVPEYAGRWKRAEWDIAPAQETGALYSSQIRVEGENNVYFIADVTAALAEMKVTLLNIATVLSTPNMTAVLLTVGCKNTDHFQSIMARLRSVRKVQKVSRV